MATLPHKSLSLDVIFGKGLCRQEPWVPSSVKWLSSALVCPLCQRQHLARPGSALFVIGDMSVGVPLSWEPQRIHWSRNLIGKSSILENALVL